MAAYYNENDKFAAAWLRNLIQAGAIADGEVDDRSIEDVQPSDLHGFGQHHFFAGIGVWSYALRRAGWPDDAAVWTGSCPCQPFSAAGKRGGFADERHLWPLWFNLIRELRPFVVFGEQVASKDGLAWLDAVSADMEGADYTIGATDTCAAGFGAPHIRQRLYFVADSEADRFARRQAARSGRAGAAHDGRNSPSGLANAGHDERQRWADEQQSTGEGQAEWKQKTIQHQRRRAIDDVGDAEQPRLEGHGGDGDDRNESRRDAKESGRPVTAPGTTRGMGIADSDGRQSGIASAAPVGYGDSALATGFARGFWRDADWLYCRDSKYRPVEPGTFPLAHGAANRVGRLRGYGNALVAPQAEEFIAAYLEECHGTALQCN